MKKISLKVDDVTATIKISKRTRYGQVVGESAVIEFDDPKYYPGVVHEPLHYTTDKTFNVDYLKAEAIAKTCEYSAEDIIKKWFRGIYSFDMVKSFLLGSKKAANELLTSEKAKTLFPGGAERWDAYVASIYRKA